MHKEKAMSKPPKYVLDDDTQESLETVMNWAQELVDIQRDDDTRDEMLDILLEVAERFNIQRSVINVEEEYDEATKTQTLTIRTEPQQDNKPKLSVVSDNSKPIDLNKWRPDDDEGH